MKRILLLLLPQSVGMHCPNVVDLRVTASDITDEVTAWVAKCPRLELVELHDNKLVTAVGYAQLLRANPKIRSVQSAVRLSPSQAHSLTPVPIILFRSLGRCDVLPQVLSTLYDPQSTYKRCTFSQWSAWRLARRAREGIYLNNSAINCTAGR